MIRRKSVSSKCRNCGKVTFMGAYCAECRKLLERKKKEASDAQREFAKEEGYVLVKKEPDQRCP
jgi:tRNA(Ile)-lysidine synthase TilS/MesJ